MTVAWIGERLAMGTRDYLNRLLYRRRKANKEYIIKNRPVFLEPTRFRFRFRPVFVFSVAFVKRSRSRLLKLKVRLQETLPNGQ
jgi:hypothetical protein